MITSGGGIAQNRVFAPREAGRCALPSPHYAWQCYFRQEAERTNKEAKKCVVLKQQTDSINHECKRLKKQISSNKCLVVCDEDKVSTFAERCDEDKVNTFAERLHHEFDRSSLQIADALSKVALDVCMHPQAREPTRLCPPTLRHVRSHTCLRSQAPQAIEEFGFGFRTMLFDGQSLHCRYRCNSTTVHDTP